MEQPVEQLVHAGRFGLSDLLLMGVPIALIVAALTWWECRHAGRSLAPLLVTLRLAALTVVLWMLAEPSMETRTRHSTARTVGIFVDTSGSMTVTDPPTEVGQAIRWSKSLGPRDMPAAVQDVDSALASFELARDFARRLQVACEKETSADITAKLAGQLLRSANAGADHLERAVRHDAVRRSGATLDPDRVRSSVVGRILPEIKAVIGDVETGRLHVAGDRASRLHELHRHLENVINELRPLATAVVPQLDEANDPSLMNRLDAVFRRNRLERVADALTEAEDSWLSRLADGVKVRRYRFDDAVTPITGGRWSALSEPEAALSAGRTDLAAVMRQIAMDSAMDGMDAVVVLTDGGHNAEADPLASARGAGDVPVFFVPVGSTQPVRDVILHHVRGPRAVFKDDQVVIDAMIDARGCEGEEVVVDLLKDGEVVDSITLPVASAMYARRLRFAHQPDDLGMHSYHLIAHHLPDEHVMENNEAAVEVEVTEQTIRVLVADQWPRWEHRFLRNLFKRDDTVEYDEMLFHEAGAGQGRSGPAFPRDLESLGRYRVVILGDVQPHVLSTQQQELLVRFVDERGGALILIAGREAMPYAYLDGPLARMLPIETEPEPTTAAAGYSLYLTAEGAMMPALQLADGAQASDRIWREQYSERHPIHDLSPWSRGRPTSRVLIAAMPATRGANPDEQPRAFLSWQRFGRGRVVYLASPATYQLRRHHGDRYHHRFWGNLLRWAVARDTAGGSKTVRLTTDRTRYPHDGEIQVRASLSDLNGVGVGGATCDIRATQGDQFLATRNLEPVPDQPGVYIGTLTNLPGGMITLELGGPDVEALLASEDHTDPVTVRVAIEPDDSAEMQDTRCNLPLLAQLADQTGGRVIPPTALAAVLGQLDLSPVVTEEIRREPLWNRWWVLAVFVGCLTTEWGVRKWAGLA